MLRLTILSLLSSIALSVSHTAFSQTKAAEKIDDAECHAPEELTEWLDRTRTSSHKRLCKSVKWFDGLFGDEYDFNDDDFRGKIVVGFEHDELDGFDPTLKIRLKTKLPNISDRLDAFIGRVEEDDYLSDTDINQDSLTNVGLRSDDDDDAEWLIGVGYRNPKEQFRGLDFSLGLKISSGINPYAKIRHQHHFELTEPHFLRTTQTIFWRRELGYGFSTSLDYTYLINEHNIYEADVSTRYTEDDSQWEWVVGTTWHHSFNDRQGMSSRVYVRGETENPVSIPEYGVTFTYRQPLFRPWFFIETGIDYRWEKVSSNDDFEDSLRFGIQAEMLLGDFYHKNQSRRNKIK